MSKSSKDNFATERYVYAVVNDLENSIENRMNSLEVKMEDRFDRVMTALVDIAGQFRKFGEEQAVLSSHSKKHTDRIENLEKKVFGSVQN